MIRLRHFVRNNRGQAMVEFALLLPVLLLILCGIIEYGRVFNETLVVTAAAREGARAAAVGKDGSAAAANSAAAINRGGLTVTVSPAVSGQPVTVTVTNPVPIITPGIAVFFPENPMIVKGVAIMRME